MRQKRFQRSRVCRCRLRPEGVWYSREREYPSNRYFNGHFDGELEEQAVDDIEIESFGVSLAEFIPLEK